MILSRSGSKWMRFGSAPDVCGVVVVPALVVVAPVEPSVDQNVSSFAAAAGAVVPVAVVGIPAGFAPSVDQNGSSDVSAITAVPAWMSAEPGGPRRSAPAPSYRLRDHSHCLIA